MADGYSRAKAGNIGVCIGTSGPAGTDMITGLYAASADSFPYGQNINRGRLGFSRVIQHR
jgi:glyoxylate carboligase